MSGMGKGNATRYASLYDGKGLSIGKPSVLSTASGAAFGMSFGTPVEQGLAETPSEKGMGSMVKGRRVWGPFSRIQGCGHLSFALDSQVSVSISICMRSSATSACGLQLLLYEAFSYWCMRP
jgi:hypothetical protein